MAEALADVKVDKDSERPNKAWARLSVKQNQRKLQPLHPEHPISEENIRFVCMSDTHGKVEKPPLPVPAGDVLIHAGDFTIKGQLGEIMSFNAYLGSLPHKRKIVIAGNHDFTFDEVLMSGMKVLPFGASRPGFQSSLERFGVKKAKDILTNCTYLEDSSCNLCGINIYGSPWQPTFCDWGFNVDRGEKILQKWNKIPQNADILITHGPPVGYGDMTAGNNNVGCVELLSTIQKRVQPKYHIFGHIHEGYGVWTDGNTIYINASTCNRKYRPINQPIVFDYPIPEGHSKDELLQNKPKS